VTGCERHVRFACELVAERAFCRPVFEPTATSGRVIVDPEATQKALEHLQHAFPSGRPRLGIALAVVPGLGVVVGAVLPGGAADGKLRAADVIVEAGGEAVTDDAVLARIVQAHAGQPLEVGIRRDGRDMKVVLDVRPF
jgi:S1-C subfamily serine protease